MLYVLVIMILSLSQWSLVVMLILLIVTDGKFLMYSYTTKNSFVHFTKKIQVFDRLDIVNDYLLKKTLLGFKQYQITLVQTRHKIKYTQVDGCQCLGVITFEIGNQLYFHFINDLYGSVRYGKLFCSFNFIMDIVTLYCNCHCQFMVHHSIQCGEISVYMQLFCFQMHKIQNTLTMLSLFQEQK